jgi:hypothetical protein
MDSLLAAKLEARGHRLGYAERARVVHHYSDHLADTIEQFATYAIGECSHRLRSDKEQCDRQFGLMSEWNEVLHERSGDFRRILTSLAGQCGRAVLSRDWPLFRAATHALRRLHGPRTLGPALSMWKAWARCHLSRRDPERMMRAFRDMCLAAVRLHRLRFLHGHAAELASRADPPHGLTPGRWLMDDMPRGALIGWHDAERFDGDAFRWSSPIAAIRLAIPPGRWRVAFETRGLRGGLAGSLRVLCHQSLAPAHLNGAGIEVTLEPRHFNRKPHELLILAIDPGPVALPDTRRLGVPVFAVDIAGQTNDRSATRPRG